jgi:hypothetical protein
MYSAVMATVSPASPRSADTLPKEKPLTIYTDVFWTYEPLEKPADSTREIFAYGDGEYADGEALSARMGAAGHWCDRGRSVVTGFARRPDSDSRDGDTDDRGTGSDRQTAERVAEAMLRGVFYGLVMNRRSSIMSVQSIHLTNSAETTLYAAVVTGYLSQTLEDVWITGPPWN